MDPADFGFENREDDEWFDDHDGDDCGPSGDYLGFEDDEWDTESHDSVFDAMREMYGDDNDPSS